MPRLYHPKPEPNHTNHTKLSTLTISKRIRLDIQLRSYISMSYIIIAILFDVFIDSSTVTVEFFEKYESVSNQSDEK